MIAQLSIPLPVQPTIRCAGCGCDLRGVVNREEQPDGRVLCFPCAHGMAMAPGVFQLWIPEPGPEQLPAELLRRP